MALKDRLKKLSEEVNIEKQAAAEAEQNENLKPLRASIKRLEKEKIDLEMIKNSLDFKKQSPEDGLGMKEYVDSSSAQKKKTRGQLEEIALENEAALERLGVKNIDELADNPEFAEEEEVVSYKKALEQEAGIVLSDTKLKNRLTKLGIEMSDDNFSYESASQEIGLRLENLEKELTAEKLKTPEGKAEITSKLAEDFSENTENIFFGSASIVNKEEQHRNGLEPSGNSYYQFYLEKERKYLGKGFRVELIDDDKTKIDNYYQLPILPKNFSEQVDKYGLEMAGDALKETYAKKVEAAFAEPINPLGQPLKMRAALEAVSPEKRRNAEELLNSFENKKSELFNILEAKSKELADKGIGFSPTYASNYGGEYKEIFKFSGESRLNRGIGRFGDDLNGDIINALRSGKPVFPEFDLDKLTALTERRISELNQAIEVIKNINDKNGVDTFLEDRKSPGYIGNFHKQSLDVYSEEIKYKNPENISYQEISALTSRANNWQEAAAFLDKEISQAEEAKKKIHEKMDELVDYNVAMYKLSAKNKSRYSLEDQKFTHSDHYDYRLRDLGDYIEKIKGENEAASNIISEIAELKAKLNPEEKVKVNGITIEVEEKTKEYKRLSEEMEKKEKEIIEGESDLRKEKSSEPWLGKDKWRARVSNLENNVNKLNQEKLDLRDNYNKNVQEAFHYLNKEKMPWGSQTKEMIENYQASGNVNEVFTELENKLMALVDKKVPEEVQKDFDKLSHLEARLRGEE